jgi:hypothetical protein
LGNLAGQQSPASPEFLFYAVSESSKALLSVGIEWWKTPGAISVSYEDLVGYSRLVLSRISGELGAFARPVFPVVEAFTIDKLSPESALMERAARFMKKPGAARH